MNEDYLKKQMDNDPNFKISIIAQMKSALIMKDKGLSKEKYIRFCKEVWELIEKEGDEYCQIWLIEEIHKAFEDVIGPLDILS